MWILILSTLFNSAASQQDVINHLRVGGGGIYIGVMEAIASVLLLYALIYGGAIAQTYPNRRTPPVLIWLLVLLILGDLMGTIGGIMHHVPIEFFLRSFREYTTWPIFIFVGYRLLGTPRAARAFLYTVIVAGIIVSTILIGNFGQNTEHYSDTMNISFLRDVAYLNAYSGMAAWLLIYTVIRGPKLLPSFIAIPTACYCLIGQCAPLNRGEWMAMFFCAAGMVLLVPAGKRISMTIKGIIVGALIVAGGALAVSIVDSATQRDFSEVLNKRFQSMLPTERENNQAKAWDTRLDSIWAELRIWQDYPVMGGGFAIQDELVYSGKIPDYHAFNHNGWASVLAKTGIFGFIGSMMIPISLLIIGRKLAMQATNPNCRLMGVLAFFSSLYMASGILSGIMWTTRFALFFGIVCGMVYRCRNINIVMGEEAYVPDSNDLLDSTSVSIDPFVDPPSAFPTA